MGSEPPKCIIGSTRRRGGVAPMDEEKVSSSRDGTSGSDRLQSASSNDISETARSSAIGRRSDASSTSSGKGGAPKGFSLPHPFGDKVSESMKKLAAKRRFGSSLMPTSITTSSGDGSRVSLLSDSFATDNGRSSTGLMSDIDRVLYSSSSMYFLNNEVRQSTDTGSDKVEGGDIRTTAIKTDRQLDADEVKTNVTAMKPGPPADGDAHEGKNAMKPNPTSITGAGDRLEGKLREKIKQNNNEDAKPSPTAISNAINQFEDRLRDKMGQNCNISTKPSPTKSKAMTPEKGNKSTRKSNPDMGLSATGFEERLRAKMGQEGNICDAKPSHATVKNAFDRFENRLKAKMELQENNSDTKPHSKIAADEFCPPAASTLSDSRRTGSEHSSTATDQFESRLKAKLGQDKKDGTASYSAKFHSSELSLSASDRFENRLMAKLNKSSTTENAAISYFTECVEEGKPDCILQYFRDNDCSSPVIVTDALEKLVDCLAHGIFDSTQTALNPVWVGILAKVMSHHSDNEMVQILALRAIWVTVALDSQYAAQFTSSGAILRSLTVAMDTHRKSQKVQDCGCGIVACVATNQEQALKLSNEEAIVERIGRALYSNSQNALKGLFRLLAADQQRDLPLHIIETIGHSTNRERQGANILANAMDTVLAVMMDSSEPGVQVWGCYLLWLLLSEERLVDLSSYERDQQSFSNLMVNILRHLETRTFPGAPQAVHESAMCVMLGISQNSHLVGNDGILLRVVAEIMQASPKSHIIAMYGCHCLSNLRLEDDTVNAILLVVKIFPNVAIDAIMQMLAEQGYQAIVTLLQNERLVGSVVETMIRHPNSSSIQMAGCHILSSIALDRRAITEICSCGGANIIVSNLCNLRQDRLLVCKAFEALTAIVGICDAAILHENRAAKRVLSTMEAHPSDIIVQVSGAALLWNLGSGPSLKLDIVDGIHILFDAMRLFLASEQMQEKGILALWVLSASDSLGPGVPSRAIEVTSMAISAHLPNAKVCEHGLGALSTLMCSRSALEDADRLFALIVSSMWVHAESATIQQGALAALSKISLDQSSNQVMQITPEDLDVVVNAMRTHTYVKGVQENAIILLRSFSFCPTNIHVFRQNPFLEGLIKTAMSKFPGSLRVNVESLLRILPASYQ
ncbi:hypothetical protein ACHAWF_007444 [Thalassiosira exigua]